MRNSMLAAQRRRTERPWTSRSFTISIYRRACFASLVLVLVALPVLLTSHLTAAEERGRLELTLACSDSGFRGEYRVGETSIAFESCSDAERTIAVVYSANGDELYRAERPNAGEAQLWLYGRELKSSMGSGTSAEHIQEFARSAEGRALVSLLAQVKRAGLYSIDGPTAQWTALFALSQAFEGIPRQEVPATDSLAPDS